MSDIIRIESISQAHEMFNLDKPKHPLVSVYQHNKIDWKPFPKGSKLSLELYHIMFKEGISGSIGYGRNSYDFQDGTIIFTSPGQVVTSTGDHSEEELTGWSVLFHPDLIRASDLGNKIDDYNFFSYDVNEALHLSDDEKKTITELTHKIENEYNLNIDKHSQNLIVANIQLILDYCTRFYDRQFYTRTNLNKGIVSKFEQLLKNYFKENNPMEQGLPSVKYCGKELNMSSNYLSDLLKKETGRNAQDHIHIYIIDKAKTQLLNSGESISQIAYRLGFEYPQHFSKLFKKKIGMSPAEYRESN